MTEFIQKQSKIETHLRSLPGGYYCGQAGLSYPSDQCEAGYYCSGGSSEAMPSGVGGDQCSPGYYCPQGSIQPIGKLATIGTH